eukprot:CAMPEP_0179047410 /NCGR_PEP_ID=MMETSP0796-20121207/19183_1 /TAXON_ID=73915 /ORGANISM="Pyrodinium bahamense, Strain pbaha01" /LENGTH=354 /DNA_ID=CAMNT_0020743855 /DNA_START=233 /DNA_END=1294 /DNA_ORIENTATION=-
MHWYSRKSRAVSLLQAMHALRVSLREVPPSSIICLRAICMDDPVEPAVPSQPRHKPVEAADAEVLQGEQEARLLKGLHRLPQLLRLRLQPRNPSRAKPLGMQLLLEVVPEAVNETAARERLGGKLQVLGTPPNALEPAHGNGGALCAVLVLRAEHAPEQLLRVRVEAGEVAVRVRVRVPRPALQVRRFAPALELLVEVPELPQDGPHFAPHEDAGHQVDHVLDGGRAGAPRGHDEQELPLESSSGSQAGHHSPPPLGLADIVTAAAAAFMPACSMMSERFLARASVIAAFVTLPLIILMSERSRSRAWLTISNRVRLTFVPWMSSSMPFSSPSTWPTGALLATAAAAAFMPACS